MTSPEEHLAWAQRLGRCGPPARGKFTLYLSG